MMKSPGIDFKQLLEYVIRPTLRHIGLGGASAEQLVLGTIIQESHGRYIKQLGGGPALGLIQMEPVTHDDIWEHFLAYKPGLAQKVRELELPLFATGATEVIGNLYYAVAMCRVHYRRVPEALPGAWDIPGHARYWKKYYNTRLGAGHPEEYELNWARWSPLRDVLERK